MAVTSNTYTVGGSGQAGPYSYSFPILADTDVKVSVNAVVKTVTTHYTLDSSNTRITFTSGNHPSTGDKVIVYRDTDEDPIKSVFSSGSTLRSTELNDNFNQLLYIAQETEDQAMSTLGGTMQANFTLGKSSDLVFEGDTDDAYETTLTVTDPTADRTITLPNVTGTVVTTGDTGTVTSTMIADGTIATADLANTAVEEAKIQDSAVTNNKIATNAVTGAKIGAGAVTITKIGADAVDGTKIADDSIDSEHIVDGSVDLAHLSANSVNSSKIVDGSIVADDIANTTITGAKLANDTVTATQIAANAITASELADNAVDTGSIVNDAVDGTKIADNSIDSDHYADGSIDTAHYAANSVDTAALAADAVTHAQLADDAVRAEHIQANAVGTSEIADAELVTLAGMPGATASILASSTALTSTTAELNLLDGKSIVTSVSGSSTDVQLPTAKAVNDQIVALTQEAGGFYPIDDELKFPNTNPDPSDDAGTIVSIADAGGIVVNGSGVSTTGRTLGGSTVTINGIDSTLNNTTIAAGKGMLVQTTSTLNTYTYHRLVVDEAGVASAQSLVTDFNQRYQVSSSTPTQQPDGTALAEGDLFFDTGANKMKVYDGSNYAEVTSVGDYKLLTVVNDGQTSGSPTYNGSIVSYDLRDGGSAASITAPGQLLVSLNGVLQKPNSGSYSASEEGFYLEGSNGIKFCTAPGSGASVFVTLIGSATTVNTPATNSVTEATIQSNVVSEEKLKVSNSPTNGYYLQAQSGNSGGLTWAAVSQYTTPLTTRGDILFRDASGDQRLAKGTDGQFLKIGANDPVWADVVGAVANGCIYENEDEITADHTIAQDKRGHSVGPLTVSATVTVNGVWVIS